MSSYNSATGKLIKSSVIYDAEKYTAYVKMSEEDLKAVYCHLFYDIYINDYPDENDPFRMMTAPSSTFIISATANGRTKTVKCENMACSTW
ncbi:MAG: hypothetical protein IJS45_01520 [Clostridia bacterium]|nr:hypothetical protein [Clostridia bacterium]